MIVVDTSAILAYMNSADHDHDAVRRWLEAAEDDLVTTPLIVAEADHLVAARGGRSASTSASSMSWVVSTIVLPSSRKRAITDHA